VPVIDDYAAERIAVAAENLVSDARRWSPAVTIGRIRYGVASVLSA